MKSPEREHENARYRRRTWNRRKSYLPKHTSLPELHLLPAGQRPIFHCQRCGFINTLIPLCLWCTWSSQEAQHEFESSTPRARRASAPAKAFFHVQLTMTSPQSQSQKYPQSLFPERVLEAEYPEPHDLTRTLIGIPGPLSTSLPMSSSLSLSPPSQKQGVNSQRPLKKSQSIVSPCVSFGIAHPPSVDVKTMRGEEVELRDDNDRVTALSSKGNPISSLQRPKRLGVRRREDRDVPTATTQSVRTQEEIDADTTVSRHTTASGFQSDSVTSLRDPLLPSHFPLPSEEQASPLKLPTQRPQPPSPSISPSPSTSHSLSPSPSASPMKSMKSLRTLKSSRRMLITDAHDTANANAKVKARPQPIHVPSHAADSIPIAYDEHAASNREREELTSTSILNSTSKPSSPLPLTPDILPSPSRQQNQNQLRTLRRKKHFNIMQSSILPLASESSAAEVQPIAISLNIRASQRDLQKSAARSKSPLRPQSSNGHIHILPKRKPSRPLSVVAPPASESGSSSDLASPPLTPTYTSPAPAPSFVPPTAPTAPPSTAPTGLSTSPSLVSLPPKAISTTTTTSTSSSPVKLGHPSRPYYSAIRKGGISSSPPPSRPTSLSGPSPSSSLSSAPSSSTPNSRPKSYTPSTTTSASLLNHFNSVTTPTTSSVASRHLSMSAMFVSPSYSPHASPFSAFSVLDDDEAENDDNDNDNDSAVDEYGVLPPTPSPGLVSFSLAAASRRLSGSRAGQSGNLFPHLLAHSGRHGHRQTMSLSSSQGNTSGSKTNTNVNTSNHRNTIGFSMSGETELRMALAAAASAEGGGGATELAAEGAARAGTGGGSGFAIKFRDRSSLSQSSTSASGVSPNPVDGEFGFASPSAPPQARIGRDLDSDSHAGSHLKSSFIGRVKKLRKGLKEMMLLSPHAHD